MNYTQGLHGLHVFTISPSQRPHGPFWMHGPHVDYTISAFPLVRNYTAYYTDYTDQVLHGGGGGIYTPPPGTGSFQDQQRREQDMSQPPWPNTEKTDSPQESQECPCGHWAPHGPHTHLADWEKALLFDEPHQNNPGLPEHLEDLHFMVGRLSREREELAEKLDTELRRTQRLQDMVRRLENPTMYRTTDFDIGGGNVTTTEVSDSSWEQEVIADYEKAKAAKKPMRIRYMELPGEINPDTNTVSSPFIIVLDRVPEDRWERANAARELIAEQTGARGVLAMGDEVQIGDDY